FWNIAVVKRTGDVTRLQALVDKKNIVISEDAIREILQLDDAEGVSVEVPDSYYFSIFEYQKTTWNEFSTAMASTVICLSKGQRFNFSRVGKGCSGIETPLFENMLQVREVDAEEEVQVSAHDDVDQENVIVEIADDVAPLTSPLPPSPIIQSLPPHQSPRTSSLQAAESSSIFVKQVLDKCSALVLRVEGLESANTAQQLEIIKLKARVKKLERLNKGRKSVDIDEGIEFVDDQEKDDQEKDAQVIPAAEHVVAAVSTPISAAKPKVLKVVPAALTISTRKTKGVVIR
nr:hypothetical protein [Tanacetum cinerariifolium]